MATETKPKFDKDQKFMITPLSVDPKHARPTFMKGGSTHYNYMVKARVKGATEPTTFEYASPTQDALDVFVLNVPQWVRCTSPSEIACNIQPCEAPGEEVTMSKEEYARKLVQDAMDGKPAPGRSPFVPNAPDGSAIQKQPYVAMPNTFNQDAPRVTNVSGNPWVFCYAWAKDFVVAEIGSEQGFYDGPGTEAPVDPMDRQAHYARRMYEAMMKDISGTP